MSWSLRQIQDERERRRCARDEKHFIRTYARIEHPLHGSIPFEMFDYQEETLDIITEHDRVLVLKARQIGYTTIVSAHVLWLALFHPHRLILALSKKQDDAEQIVRKIKHAYNYLPEWLRQALPALIVDNLQELEWDNGSRVEALPSKDDPARSRTASLIVLDEWAFYNNPEAAWAAAQPVADVGGQIIALSTANGAGTLFERQWQLAVQGKSSFKAVFYPWWVRRERDADWYERQKGDLLEWQLNQEYPSDPDEAFIKSGNMVFDADMLKAIDQRIEDEGLHGRPGFLWRHPRALNVFEFRHLDRGELRVWKLPGEGDSHLRPNRFVLAADVAQGLEHGDFSSVHVINVRTGEVVAVWHGHVDPDIFGAEIINDLGRFYRNALAGVEANNHGLTTLKALQRMKYPRIYMRRRLGSRNEKASDELGWLTTANSKALAIDELRKALRSGELDLMDTYTVAELRTFVRDEKGKMAGSPFDDRVMSLAIAEQMRRHIVAPEYQDKVNDYNTITYWERVGAEEIKGAELVIGSHRGRRREPRTTANRRRSRHKRTIL